MADKKDDPREVLTLLNSLGFVGITAQQLKAFMKDLKMHRKIKERERQQWKDDTKKKILLRQQELYKEVLQEHKIEKNNLNNISESTISSESSTFREDSSYKIVTVKIRCVPKENKENEHEENANDNNNNDHNNQRKKTSFKKTHTSWAEEFRQNNSRREDNEYSTSSSNSIHESHRKSFNHSNNQSQNYSTGASTDSTRYISLEKPKKRASRSEEHILKQTNLPSQKFTSPSRLTSSSSRRNIVKSENLKSTSEHTTEAYTNPPPSRSSVQSRAKSFIRPWRLQPDSHRSSTNTKSDPVALYQKYKEEWKQLALPGEENHAGIRWAVREKMLGIDPNPRLDTEMIDEINRNDSGISEREEYKIYKMKSRKIEKKYFNSNSIEYLSKPVTLASEERYYESFDNISESLSLEARNSRSRKRFKVQTSPSVRASPTALDVEKYNEIKIQHNFETKSLLHRVSSSSNKELDSEFTSAKTTLSRIVTKLLKKDINSYVETYKYENKCRCVMQREKL